MATTHTVTRFPLGTEHPAHAGSPRMTATEVLTHQLGANEYARAKMDGTLTGPTVRKLLKRTYPGTELADKSTPQSRLESALEATVNIGTGFVISYLVWLFAVPVLFGPDVSSGDPVVAFWLTTVFTVTSWLRSYVWRRFFNASIHKRIHRCLQR